MALIKCPECNKEISDKSNTYVHCGYYKWLKIKEAPTFNLAYSRLMKTSFLIKYITL